MLLLFMVPCSVQAMLRLDRSCSRLVDFREPLQDAFRVAVLMICEICQSAVVGRKELCRETPPQSGVLADLETVANRSLQAAAGCACLRLGCLSCSASAMAGTLLGQLPAD